MTTAFIVVIALVCALGPWGNCVAQEEAVARFDAAHARATAGGVADRGEAAAEALAWFLRIEDLAARGTRLADGVDMALATGKPAVGLQLAEEAIATRGSSLGLAALKVRSLAALGRLSGVVDACREAGGPGQDAAVFVAMATPELRQVEAQLLPLADRALREGATADALWVFETLVQADPEDGIRLANLALTLRHLGRRAEAAAAYRQAMEVAPGDDQIRSDHGLFLRACGNWAAASGELRRAMALEAVPGTGPAITNLVQMEVMRPGSVGGDVASAAARALGLRPDAAMLRRVTLDLVGDRLRNPDKRPTSR